MMKTIFQPVGAGIVAMAIVFSYTHITVVSAFNTIFPLLWLTHRIGSPPFLPLIPPFATLTIPNNKKNDSTDKMIQWLEGIDGGGSFSSSVKVDSDARTGLRGLFATKDIKSGEIIVEIPYNAALLVGDTLNTPIFDTFEEVTGSEDWPEEDFDDVYQGLNFLQSFMKDRDYTPYVNTLPHVPSSGDDAGLTPDFWSKEYILGLEVPKFVKQILHRKQIVEEVAKKNNVNEDELRWATWMIRSRRITTWNMVDDPNSSDDEKLLGVFPTKKIEQIQGFLIPLIDMANHAHNPNAVLKISVNRWTRQFDDTSTFALRALKPINKGEEVTILYGEGDRTSLDLLGKFVDGCSCYRCFSVRECQPDILAFYHIPISLLADKYGFFVEGNDADKTIDWEELKPEFTTSIEKDEAELATWENSLREKEDKSNDVISLTTDRLKSMVSKIQSYEPNFSSKLDDLVLVGYGMRIKMGIKIYAVAMYGSTCLGDVSGTELRNAVRTFGPSSPKTTFVLEMVLQADSETIAEAIANSVKLRYGGAQADVQYLEALIAEGVTKECGGQASKGCTLQFDCSEEGVKVIVDGNEQGTAKFKGLGSAFVDVFMDDNTVSPSLIENCGENCNIEEGQVDMDNTANSGPESKRTMLSLRVLMKRLSNWQTVPSAPDADDSVQLSVSVNPESTGPVTSSSFDSTSVEAKIRELEAEIEAEIERAKSLGVQVEGLSETTTATTSQTSIETDVVTAVSTASDGKATVKDTAEEATSSELEQPAVSNYEAVESMMKSLKEKATGVTFDAKLDAGLYLVGVGVRKKAIINVYAVAMYSSPATLEALSPFPRGKLKKDAQTALLEAARTFGPSSPKTTFVLEMTFKADGATIGGAIAEGVQPRYNGSPSDVKELESLIIEGVKVKGGQATKGTIFRFDCTQEGVKVSVDGNEQGVARFDGIGSALVDVFMDDKAVSPQLVDSCLDTWSGSGL